jgi:hypothetical protein
MLTCPGAVTLASSPAWRRSLREGQAAVHSLSSTYKPSIPAGVPIRNRRTSRADGNTLGYNYWRAQRATPAPPEVPRPGTRHQ